MSVLTTCGGYGGQSDNSEDDDTPEEMIVASKDKDGNVSLQFI